jgi:hypothetical protein
VILRLLFVPFYRWQVEVPSVGSKGRKGRVYHIRAESEVELDKWMLAFEVLRAWLARTAVGAAAAAPARAAAPAATRVEAAYASPNSAMLHFGDSSLEQPSPVLHLEPGGNTGADLDAGAGAAGAVAGAGASTGADAVAGLLVVAGVGSVSDDRDSDSDSDVIIAECPLHAVEGRASGVVLVDSVAPVAVAQKCAAGHVLEELPVRPASSPSPLAAPVLSPPSHLLPVPVESGARPGNPFFRAGAPVSSSANLPQSGAWGREAPQAVTVLPAGSEFREPTDSSLPKPLPAVTTRGAEVQVAASVSDVDVSAGAHSGASCRVPPPPPGRAPGRGSVVGGSVVDVARQPSAHGSGTPALSTLPSSASVHVPMPGLPFLAPVQDLCPAQVLDVAKAAPENGQGIAVDARALPSVPPAGSVVTFGAVPPSVDRTTSLAFHTQAPPVSVAVQIPLSGAEAPRYAAAAALPDGGVQGMVVDAVVGGGWLAPTVGGFHPGVGTLASAVGGGHRALRARGEYGLSHHAAPIPVHSPRRRTSTSGQEGFLSTAGSLPLASFAASRVPGASSPGGVVPRSSPPLPALAVALEEAEHSMSAADLHDPVWAVRAPAPRKASAGLLHEAATSEEPLVVDKQAPGRLEPVPAVPVVTQAVTQASSCSSAMWGGLFHCACADPSMADTRIALIKELFERADGGRRGVVVAQACLDFACVFTLPTGATETAFFKLCALLAHPLALPAFLSR